MSENPVPDDERPEQDATQPFTKPDADPDATRQLPPTGDATRQLPPVGDADAWTGRAEVRGPTPPADTEEWTDQGEPEEPGRRWWLPILLGLIGLLVVIGAIAGFMALNNDSGGPNPIPSPSRPASTSATPSPSAPPSPSPSPASPNPVTVVVPVTSGDTQAVATGKLTALGLVVHIQTQEDPGPPGIVLGSSPTAGTEVPAGSDITLIISKALPSEKPSPPAPSPTHAVPEESLSPAGIASRSK